MWKIYVENEVMIKIWLSYDSGLTSYAYLMISMIQDHVYTCEGQTRAQLRKGIHWISTLFIIFYFSKWLQWFFFAIIINKMYDTCKCVRGGHSL